MEPWSHEHFIREVKPRWGNSPKSKILVVTRDKNLGNGLIENCRSDTTTNKMETRVTKWVDYPSLNNEIYSWQPITLVITFDDRESSDIERRLQEDMGVNDDDPDQLFKFRIFQLKNIFNSEQCILLSTTKTSARAVAKRLRDACLENEATTRVLVISGGHGGIKEDSTRQPLEHNGSTGFTNFDDLDYELYKEDCETVGIEPRRRIHLISGTKRKPVGEPQEMAASARRDCLMSDLDFNQIQFNVLNIAEFHKDADGLMKFIRDFKPTVLMISWCFSTTCDLAMMLRREGVFGTMFATYDLRTITGDPNAKLSDQQREVLENNRGEKVVVLAGNFGVGKTILLCELAKAVMAEKGWETAKVRIFHQTFTAGQKLNEYLEDTFKPVWHKDVKVVTKVELEKEFPGNSDLLLRMGRKIEEEETRLIVVGDEMYTDLEIVGELKHFKHTKFLLALHAELSPDEKLLKDLGQKLQFQYRNTEKILAFMHFESEFCNEVRKTTGNPDYRLTIIIRRLTTDPGESLPKPLPSSPHPVVWLPVTDPQNLVRETIEAMKSILKTGQQHLDVVVLYDRHIASMSDAAKEICNAGERELGTFTWKHYAANDYRGCEARVVILLGDSLWMHYISRARNQLVIVTTGKKMELTEEFYSRYEQRRSKFDFTSDEHNNGDWRQKSGDCRDMLQLSADLGKLKKMGADTRIFRTEFPFLEEKASPLKH